MLKLRKNLKVLPPSSPGEPIKVENPDNGKTINIGPKEVQILRLIAKYPIETAALKLKVEQNYIDNFVEQLRNESFLEDVNSEAQLKQPPVGKTQNKQHASQHSSVRQNTAWIKPEAAIEARLDLQFSQDGDSLLIEDPISNRFFTLAFKEASLFYLLIEKSLDEVSVASGYTRSELQAFIDDLGKKNLLVRPSPIGVNNKAPQRNLLSLFVQRFKLGDPDALLSGLNSSFGWLWQGPLIGVHIAVILFGAFLWVDQASLFQQYGFPKLADGFWLNALIFLVIVSIVLALHEFAHGLTLKSYGGKVPEMGVFVLYGFPAAYTNVSGAYKLQSKVEKIWVVLAGVMFQAWVGSLAMIIWAFATPHTWLSDLAYMFTFAAWFNLAINLNPLVKLDGYYLLTLFLNKPNLRANSWQFLSSAFSGAKNFSEACLYFAYGLLSVIYTSALFYFIIGGFLRYGIENMPLLSGLLVFLIFLASQTPLPASEILKLPNIDQSKRSLASLAHSGFPSTTNSNSLSELLHSRSQSQDLSRAEAFITPNKPIQREDVKENKAAFNIFPLVLLLVGGFVLYLKVPYSVGGEVEINPSVSQRALIRPSIQGVIQKIYVKPGDSVKAGDKVVEIVDWGLMDQISQSTGANPFNEGASPRLNSLNSQIQQEKIQARKLEIELQKAQLTAANERKKASTYTLLAKEGAYPKTLAEQAELNAKVAEQEIQKLREEIKLNRELQGTAASNFQTLSGQIQYYKQKAKRQIITSPINGYVLTEDTDLQNGDLTSPDKVLFTVADLKDVQVKIKIPQEDLPMVKVGQPINLSIKAFPGETFKGKVSDIAIASEDPRKADPTLTKDTTRKHWNVTMVIDNSKLVLKPGMTGFAYIDSKQEQRIYQLIWREAYRVLPLERFAVMAESMSKAKL